LTFCLATTHLEYPLDMLVKEEYRETYKQYGLKLTVQKKQCLPFVCTFLMEKKDNVIYVLLENGKLSWNLEVNHNKENDVFPGKTEIIVNSFKIRH